MGVRQFAKDTLWWMNVRTVYQRITLTRFTTLYFLLAVASCILQVAFQGATLSANAQSIGVTSAILTQGNIPMGFPVIEDNSLQFCDSIPGQNGTLCVLVAGHPTKNNSMTFNPQTDQKQDQAESHEKFGRSITSQPEFNSAGNLTSIQLSGMPSSKGKPVSIDGRCVLSLTWLSDRLGDAEREDVVTLAFQVWLLGLSLVAILNESIPHLFAVLASHALDTIWAGVRVGSNAHLRSEYEQFIVNDACDGVDMYSSLWNTRGSLAIALLSVNLVTFCALVYLSVELYKVYHAQTLKHFGTSVRVNMVYKSVLALSIFLQMAGFFVLASTALWIDKVSSGSISHVAEHLTYYQIAFVATAILEIPWLILGWISVRREKRTLFIGFSIFGAILVAIESIMFASALYRFVFSAWSFFAMMTVFAYILLVSSVILGFLCRIQFGNGLVDYLTIEEKVEGPEFETIANGVQEKDPVQEAAPEKDFRLTQFIVSNPESVTSSIVTPPNAVVRGGDSPNQLKSMLRRFSGRSGQTAVAFADRDSRRGYPSPAPTDVSSIMFNNNPSPTGPAQRGSVKSPQQTPFPTSRWSSTTNDTRPPTVASRSSSTLRVPQPPFPTNSRWSMSTSGVTSHPTTPNTSAPDVEKGGPPSAWFN